MVLGQLLVSKELHSSTQAYQRSACHHFVILQWADTNDILLMQSTDVEEFTGLMKLSQWLLCGVKAGAESGLMKHRT